MSFYDFFHKVFGGIKGDDNRFFHGTEESDNLNSARDSTQDFDGNDQIDSIFDFAHTIRDPFEMHQFLEAKINEVFKHFHGPDLLPSLEIPKLPAIEENVDPRDFYLKPEFNKSKQHSRNEQEDSGNKTEDSPWMDRMFPAPYQQPVQPKTFSSFRTVIRKSVTLPDGTVRTEEIIKSSDGTEQRTESETLPDGSSLPRFDFPYPSTPAYPGFSDPTKIIPKYDFLKPGYERLHPNAGKFDKDLDKELSEIGHLPSFSMSPVVPEAKPGFSTKSFTRKTVVLPSGVVKSEEIVKNVDGSEERTVTETVTEPKLSKYPAQSAESSISNNKDVLLLFGAIKSIMDSLFK